MMQNRTLARTPDNNIMFISQIPLSSTVSLPLPPQHPLPHPMPGPLRHPRRLLPRRLPGLLVVVVDLPVSSSGCLPGRHSPWWRRGRAHGWCHPRLGLLLPVCARLLEAWLWLRLLPGVGPVRRGRARLLELLLLRGWLLIPATVHGLSLEGLLGLTVLPWLGLLLVPALLGLLLAVTTTPAAAPSSAELSLSSCVRMIWTHFNNLSQHNLGHLNARPRPRQSDLTVVPGGNILIDLNVAPRSSL
mmetsp:Transcript_58156/g.173556  ORF Transcript_58156/g.173556 Transcript_58156/m.173556 type:complete len:245 (-) Transcript_58156:196-930(-)